MGKILEGIDKGLATWPDQLFAEWESAGIRRIGRAQGRSGRETQAGRPGLRSRSLAMCHPTLRTDSFPIS